MEVKTTVSTAELLPLISALKLEMQKKRLQPFKYTRAGKRLGCAAALRIYYSRNSI